MKNVISFTKSYGFFVILCFCFGVITPDFSPKVGLMDIDINNKIESNSGSSLFKQMFWVFSMLFYSLVFLLSKESISVKKYLFKKVLLIYVVITISLLTVILSEYPMIAFKRSIFQLIFFTTFMLSFYFCYINRKIVNVLVCFFIVFVAFSLLSIALGVGFTSNYSFVGFSSNKNIMGISLVFIVVFITMLKPHFGYDLKRYKLFLCVFIFLLLLTKSKTSISLLFLYFLMININLHIIKYVNFLSLISFTLIFILVPYLSNVLNSYYHPAMSVDGDFLTGRGFIWEVIYYDLNFYSKLSTGYGYGSYFGVPELPFFFDEEYSFLRLINSAHNGYLEFLIQFGAIGSMIIVTLFYVSIKRNKSRYLEACLTIVIYHNLTESTFYKDIAPTWFFYIFILSVYILENIKNKYKV